MCGSCTTRKKDINSQRSELLTWKCVVHIVTTKLWRIMRIRYFRWKLKKKCQYFMSVGTDWLDWTILGLTLSIFKGPKQRRCLPLSPNDGNAPSFRNAAIPRILDDSQGINSSNSACYTPSSEHFRTYQSPWSQLYKSFYNLIIWSK
jgi:hypothetical protein